MKEPKSSSVTGPRFAVFLYAGSQLFSPVRAGLVVSQPDTNLKIKQNRCYVEAGFPHAGHACTMARQNVCLSEIVSMAPVVAGIGSEWLTWNGLSEHLGPTSKVGINIICLTCGNTLSYS